MSLFRAPPLKLCQGIWYRSHAPLHRPLVQMGYGENILPEQAENQGDLGILEIRH